MTTDPKRLLDLDPSTFEARLLASALDEVPPARLVSHTLTTVGVAGTGAALMAATTKTALGAAKVGGLFASSGLGTAAVLGALAGVVAVGAANTSIGYVTGPARSTRTEHVPLPRPDPTRIPARPEAPRVVAPRDHEPVAPSAEVRREPGEEPRQEPRPSRVVRAVRETGALDLPMDEQSPTPTSALSLARETALLDEARSALLAGDVNRGQAALDQHAKEFPQGQLANEAGSLRAKLNVVRRGTIR
jgi:hypothetical protein